MSSDPHEATNRKITAGLIANQLALHSSEQWLSIIAEAMERVPEMRARRRKHMTQLTPHFSISEFACHDGTPYPDEWVEERLLPLCGGVLEPLREACDGRRIHILSGYRTPDYNEALRTSDGSGSGVAKDSQHPQGRAADIAVDGLAPSEVWRVLDALVKAGKVPQLGGRGIYPGWVHVDVRPHEGHIAQWLGKGVRDFPA